MDKLFEIVGSLIPDEQKADIKAKFDGELTKTLNDNEIKLKRELSSKYNVDLFEDDIEKSYKNKNFIRKEKYDEDIKELNDLKALVEANETTTKELQEKLNGYETNHNKYESSLKLVGAGFNPDRLKLINHELTGVVEDDLKMVGEKYPEMFQQTTTKRTPFPTPKDDEEKTGMQAYFERRQKEAKTII